LALNGTAEAVPFPFLPSQSHREAENGARDYLHLSLFSEFIGGHLESYYESLGREANIGT